MTKSSRYPSYVDCVVQILSQSKEPMTLDALVTSVAGQRPITRNARGAISRALEQLYQAVPMPLGHFGWLSSILTGSMFRHPLAIDEAKRGFLLLDELEHAVFFPEFFQCYSVDNRTLTIELLGGPLFRRGQRSNARSGRFAWVKSLLSGWIMPGQWARMIC